MLSSPARLVSRAPGTKRPPHGDGSFSPLADSPVLLQHQNQLAGLLSPFRPLDSNLARSAYAENGSPPVGLFDSHAWLDQSPEKQAAHQEISSTRNTPDCPPPVLQPDSMPRFATPDSVALGVSPPMSLPRPSWPPNEVLAHDATPEQRGRGRKFPSLRLRSKSQASRSREHDCAVNQELTINSAAPHATRPRRQSLSDKFSAVFSRRKRVDPVPPLPKNPEASRPAAVSSAPSLLRSYSSPDLVERSATLRLSPTVLDLDKELPATPLPADMRGREALRVDTEIPSRSSSVPTLSPSGSQTISLLDASINGLCTPQDASPPILLPANGVFDGAPTSTPEDITRHQDLWAVEHELGGQPAPPSQGPAFSFVPAVMAKQRLKRGKSVPNLRTVARPPSPAYNYLGHPLLPQTDNRSRFCEPPAPLPAFIAHSMLVVQDSLP